MLARSPSPAEGIAGAGAQLGCLELADLWMCFHRFRFGRHCDGALVARNWQLDICRVAQCRDIDLGHAHRHLSWRCAVAPVSPFCVAIAC